jgi:hypothetical protein
VVAERRSIHPHLAGVPWWAAVVIAVTATAVGFAFDAGSGDKELTHVFGGLYVLGCVGAVLAVEQSGVFTAVIQPPLILFCSVPGAYWLFHGATFTGIKNALINCGYPLIERFPLMLFTSAGVLLIGMVRWYLGMATRRGVAANDRAGNDTARTAKIATTLTSIWNRYFAQHSDGADRDRPAAKPSTGRRRSTEPPARATAGARSGTRPAATRSRRPRPPRDDAAQPERPRRRPEYRRGGEPGKPGPEPRRRRRDPRDDRREPPRRSRGPARSSRIDSSQPVEPPQPPRRRRPAATGPNGADPTHHPISQVRYRGTEPRPRPPRKPEPDSWEYDI